MIIPLRTDSPLRTSPYVNWALILANIIIFAITASHPHLADQYSLSARQPMLFQFFSYQFLHADALHIAGNMLFLYIFGNNVNDRLGHIGYLALYLAGGIFAAVSFIVTSHSGNALVGASGSIATVTGAYMVLLPRSHVTILYFYFYFGVTEVASVWFILFFFVYDIFLNAAKDNVAHTAHIGGTIYGALLCMLLLWLRLVPRDPFDVVAMIQRWNRRRQYRDMVASGYNPFEYTQGSGGQTARPTRSGAGSSGPPPLPNDSNIAQILQLRSSISDAAGVHNLDEAAQLYLSLKKLDPRQTLNRQTQLDVANHLAHQQLHTEAAEAYECYLQSYAKSEQVAQVELMLGLIYARYLNQPAKAKDYLQRAVTKYHGGRELELAKEELMRLNVTGQA